jgi:hypothetical protein
MAESKALEIEDLFKNNNVFINALRGTPAHSDSYMTIIDFEAFEKSFKEIKDKFTKEEWLDASAYWINKNYLSSVIGLLGRLIKRKFE